MKTFFGRFVPAAMAAACLTLAVAGCESSDGTPHAKPVNFSGTIETTGAVDLGLSVQWAACNLGSTAPEQYGDSYAWGETAVKSGTPYNKEEYTMWDGDKYSTYSTTDGAVRLNHGEDAATVALGDGWRMPSAAEIRELEEKCTWTYSTYNGVRGYVVTAAEDKGGRSIFLPLTGYKAGTSQTHQDARGIYWSGELHATGSDFGVTLSLNDEGPMSGMMHRYYGAAVRPVCVLGADNTESGRSMPDVEKILSASSIIGDVAWTSTQTLADGVNLTQMVATLSTGYPQSLHILTVDLQSPGVHMHVARPDNSLEIPAGAWPRQTLTDMAGALDSSDDKVLAMVNSSFWHTTTFTPRGPVHSAGSILWDQWQPTTKQGLSYIGYTSAGYMRIGDSAEYNVTIPGIFTDLTGAGLILVSMGQAQSGFTDVDREPRTAIGYTQDNFLYLLVGDGRNPGIAEGLTMEDMAAMFVSLGCIAAVNEDGGGSSQMLVRDPSTDNFKICNRPSDGAERPVIDGWTVMLRQ